MISDQKPPIDTASLKKRGVPARKGNQILNHLMGVEIRYMDTDSYEDIYGKMDRIGIDPAPFGCAYYILSAKAARAAPIRHAFSDRTISQGMPEGSSRASNSRWKASRNPVSFQY